MNEFAITLRPSPPIGDDGAVLVIERDSSSASTARRWLTQSLAHQDLPPTQLEDAALILSELVTNAWRHGAGQVTVQLALADEGDIQLYVSDSAPALPTVAPTEDARLGGWGLQIVATLARAWGVEPGTSGKTVWATVPPTPASSPIR